jgi:hypothetical protein
LCSTKRFARPNLGKGKTGGHSKSSVLVGVDGKFVRVSNKVLNHVSVYVPRAIQAAENDWLHLKANRKLTLRGRVTNGELVTVKSVRPDDGIKLADGRVLDKCFREFLPGYAVTSYGSKGKTVDYVLFSDSTVKAATNTQQGYVTISRGRRGIRIFTPAKQQLRENVARRGYRPLALGFAPDSPLAAEAVFGTGCTVICFDSGSAPLTDFAASRRLADNTINPKINRSKKSSECCTTDPNAECLRIEVSPGHSLLLPYDEFAYAELRAMKSNKALGWSLQWDKLSTQGVSRRRFLPAIGQ